MANLFDLASRYLEGAKGFYLVTRKIRDNVYKLRDVFEPRNKYILKIILDKDHPLYQTGVSRGSERTVCFHRLLQRYKISPKVKEYSKIEGGYAIIMSYIEKELDENIIKDPLFLKAVDSQIKKLHSLDIVHGDLHSQNIRYEKEIDVKTGKNKYSVYIIDFDTSFFMKEWKNYNFPKKWIEYGFDMTSLEEFLEHERTQYKNIIDD